MKIREICMRITAGYAAGQSGMDDVMLPHLVALADRAETIRKLFDAAEELRAWNWFDENPAAVPNLPEAKAEMLRALKEAC